MTAAGDEASEALISATSAQADALIELATQLRNSTNRQFRKRDVALTVTVIGLIADIILSVFLIASNLRINGVATRNAQSIHEQCSLYKLILPSYSNVNRAKSPLGPAEYDAAYRSIQVSSDNLRCGIGHVVPAAP